MEPNEQTRLLDAPDGAAPTYGQAPAAPPPPADETPAPERRRRLSKLSILTLAATSTLVAVGAVLALLYFLWWAPADGASPLPDPELTGPVRVMIVGDSISQGWEGDFTWRYRMWEWFRANGINATFVGPYTGTAHPAEGLLVTMQLPLSPAEAAAAPGPGPASFDGGYSRDVAPEFVENGSAHYSIWGRQAFQDASTIAEQVRDYRPDLLLVELGFNDLGWFVSGPEGTLDSMRRMVDNARAINPTLKFAIANVPHRSLIPGREDLPINTNKYNELLRNAIPLWSFPTSPVELVKFQEAYSCAVDDCPAAYDGLHPGPQGEYEIAYAFSEALFDKFGMGRGPLEIPAKIPVRACPTPMHPNAAAGSRSILFSWEYVFGAYGYEVQARRKGSSWPPDGTAFYTQSLRFDAPWAADGKVWQFRARTYCGIVNKSEWTPVVSAVVTQM